MIRPANAQDLGNLQDADICHWPAAATLVEERYGASAKLVVPGHGPIGTTELLAHTVRLAASAPSSCVRGEGIAAQAVASVAYPVR
jgi:hypothetical protein